MPSVKLLFYIVLFLFVLWFLGVFNTRSNFTLVGGSASNDCTIGQGYQFPTWPNSDDCDAWIDYLSTGYPSTLSRGNQAQNMQDEWMPKATDKQNDEIFWNILAYNNVFGDPLDVATVVSSIAGEPGMSKHDLCGVAKVITTPPANACQLTDWKENYMATMNSSVQATLNTWLSGC